MPTFTPPVTDGNTMSPPGAHRMFRFYGAVAQGKTVWKDQAGVWHSSTTPYLGGATHTVHDGATSTVTAADEGLATAQAVYLGGHVYEVTDAVRAELVAAGFFVGGHWTTEEDRWTAYVIASETNRGFKSGDATCSINLSGQSAWGHADTAYGTTVDGFVQTVGIVKNSVVLRSDAGAFTGQVYSAAGPAPAYAHPTGGGFTMMDMVYNGGLTTTDIVAVGWAEPTTFGGSFGEGLLMTVNAFLGANTFTEYSLAAGKFFVVGVYRDTTFMYIIGRESDFSLVLPGGNVFNNDAQQNWVNLARCPVGSLTNSATWEYWSGSGWSSSNSVLGTTSRLVDSRGEAIKGIADMTKSGDNYILAVIDPRAPTVKCYRSTVPQGPWTLYHQTADPDRSPDAGDDPPENTRYWSGFPKFHEYLNPDSSTLLITHSHGLYVENLTNTAGPIHASQNIPNFVYLPTPEAVT